jgi:hypothetical protein
MNFRDKKIIRITIGIIVLIGLVIMLSFPAAEYYRQSLGKDRGWIAGYSLSYLAQLSHSVERLVFGFNRNPYGESYIIPKEIRDKHQKPQPEVARTIPVKAEPCWLKRNSEAGTQEIFNFPYCNSKMIFWKGHLIFSEWQNENIRLIALEPESGEKKILYDLFESRDDIRGAATDFDPLQVINGRLYFSVGGYAAASAIYVLNDIKDSSLPELIFTS